MDCVAASVRDQDVVLMVDTLSGLSRSRMGDGSCELRLENRITAMVDTKTHGHTNMIANMILVLTHINLSQNPKL